MPAIPHTTYRTSPGTIRVIVAISVEPRLGDRAMSRSTLPQHVPELLGRAGRSWEAHRHADHGDGLRSIVAALLLGLSHGCFGIDSRIDHQDGTSEVLGTANQGCIG